MCLILLAHQIHRSYPLIVAANRDEFYARATASAHYWQPPQTILAGRDLEAGGTWLGVSATGRFAAVTNVTEPPPMEVLRSRGELITGFLLADGAADAYGATLEGGNYRGYNLLLWDGATLRYESNRHPGRTLPPGIYGLANAGLDEAKHRVTSGRAGLEQILTDADQDAAPNAGTSDETLANQLLANQLLDVLADRQHPDKATPDLTLDPARLARFIVGNEYGTRASTVVMHGADKIHFAERVFAAGGVERGQAQFSFVPSAR